MENITFVIFGMGGEFWDEIIFSAYENGFGTGCKNETEWNDYCAMMCGL